LNAAIRTSSAVAEQSDKSNISNFIIMGSSSKFHGLTGISSRRIKSNVAQRTRKTKLNARKKADQATLAETLKSTPEVG
jgi:actin-related protein